MLQSLKLPIMTQPKKVLTEDTGKIFEMAICLAYGIKYDGKFKYDIGSSEKLKLRLDKLPELFPMCNHTAKKGSRYDFTSVSNTSYHLSAKSAKKGVGKVAPQVIGQAKPEKFCKVLGIDYISIITLKEHIQVNIKNILPIIVDHTFDCPNIYYNRDADSIRFITLNTPIDWSKYTFKWTRNWIDWTNSTTLKIVIEEKEISLIEFQFHTKSRTNMAIRWFYENFLSVFNNNISIVSL